MNMETALGRIKKSFRLWLLRKGWIVRKEAGLSDGVDLMLDLRRRFSMVRPFVVDVGAHHGEIIKAFLDAFPQCKVLAFAPIAASFKVLCQQVGRYPNVRIIRSALSNRIGSIEICLHADSQANSLLHKAKDTPWDSEHVVNKHVVDVTTLGWIAEEEGLKQVDILKIDVEGFEIQVLEEARDLLQNRIVQTILRKLTLDLTDMLHTYLRQLVDHLNPNGYRVVAFYDQVIWSHPLRLGYGNVLFTLKEDA